MGFKGHHCTGGSKVNTGDKATHTCKLLYSLIHFPSISSSASATAGDAEAVVLRERPSVKTLANRFERNSRRKSSIFSSSSAKKKWRDFEKKV